MADAITLLPPILAIIVAVSTRNVYWALGVAILCSETLISQLNPAVGLLAAIDRSVDVLTSTGNARILLFCLIIGALIALMKVSGGIGGMVRWLTRTGVTSTRRRTGVATVLAGVILFVETNISLLTSGIMGQPLFDRLKMSRERLAYIIDSTSAPISVLLPLNGWGAYALVLISDYSFESPVGVLMGSVLLNFYALLTIAFVAFTVMSDKTFGPLAVAEQTPDGASIASADEYGHPVFMALPVVVLVVGTLFFMTYTGGGNLLNGSGSQSILWAVILATIVAFVITRFGTRQSSQNLIDSGFRGMADLLPAVSVIFLSLALGASLKALGTGEFIAGLASQFPAPFAFPAIIFVAAALTSFSTGTSWGTYGIMIPVAMPIALGSGLPPELILAAVLGGGVFGDHCSPISDTSIIASLAAGCDHIDHIRTQLPYAVTAALLATMGYLVAGGVAIGG